MPLLPLHDCVLSRSWHYNGLPGQQLSTGGCLSGYDINLAIVAWLMSLCHIVDWVLFEVSHLGCCVLAVTGVE